MQPPSLFLNGASKLCLSHSLGPEFRTDAPWVVREASLCCVLSDDYIHARFGGTLMNLSPLRLREISTLENLLTFLQDA